MSLVDELDILLTRYKDTAERIKIVADATIQSPISSNPFKLIKDTVIPHRAELGFEKASGCIALLENISTQQGRAKLYALAWNSPYLKKQ